MTTTATKTGTMIVRISANEKGSPAGKLADAELHFTDGPLAGLKLIGFAIWERRSGGGRNVTFPARQYSVNGERRSFALLRPIVLCGWPWISCRNSKSTSRRRPARGLQSHRSLARSQRHAPPVK